MNKKTWGYIIFALWCIAAIYGMMHHEIWRDEMRALSIAIESPGFLSLPGYLLNEGHPVLWYFLLKIAWLVYHSTWVLPILSLLFAAGIAWFLLFRSPFPLIFSVIIIFGTWCLYEYGINCRNYGIAAFLFLFFADLKTRKPEKIIYHFIILALVAQTNVYASMMAMVLGCGLVMEMYASGGNLKKTWVGFGILAASFLFVLHVTKPGTESLVLTNDHQNFNNLFTFKDIGYGFPELIYKWIPNNNLVSLLLWLSLLAFIPKIRAIILLIITLQIMSFFSLYYRMNFIQHQGMWIYTYIVLLWVNYKDIREFLVSKHWAKYFSFAGLAMFSFILISNLYRAYDAYFYDIKGLKSDSKDAGQWFVKNIKEDDIIIAEPDYIMESIMFYSYKPFYLPREKVFNTFGYFTKANARVLHLNRLHQIADSFSATGKTTYLILGKHFTSDTVRTYSYEKKFIVDSVSLAELKTKYQQLDSFTNNWYCDERYFIFKRRPILDTKALNVKIPQNQ